MQSTLEEFVYNGQRENGQSHGYGRITKHNFALYEGQFVQNRREGLGVELYANSDLYLGEFRGDQKHGLGLYLFAAGGYYHGFFARGAREGFGVVVGRSGRLTYRGFWLADSKSGRGIEFYKNGSKFDGFFANDKRNGVGFMEYSKNLLYMGEWSDGLRNGIGKVESGRKTVSGRFKNDRFEEPCVFNAGAQADLLLANPLPSGMEEYLRQSNYRLKRPLLRSVGELYSALKESLAGYVLSLSEGSVVRLSCYLKLKNIFSKYGRFEHFMDDLLLALRYEPNLPALSVFWEPALREILVTKADFAWQRWIIELHEERTDILGELKANGEGDKNNLKKSETNLSNEKNKVSDNDKKFDVQIRKSDDIFQLTITNELALGKTIKGEEAEAVLSDEGFELRYYNAEAEWQRTGHVKVFPFFLLEEVGDERSVLSQKVNMFSGEFYFGRDNIHSRQLTLFLAVDQEGTFYSVGTDAVGSFILAGRWDKVANTGQLLQKYVADYQIEYEMFLATADKLQGLWRTTNMEGHFVLRRETGFRFSTELARTMCELIDQQEAGKRPTANDLSSIAPLMDASILSVIVGCKQGGVPEFLEHKRAEEEGGVGDVELFEKYKKLQENESTIVDPANNQNGASKRTTIQQAKKDIDSLSISRPEGPRILDESRSTFGDLANMEPGIEESQASRLQERKKSLGRSTRESLASMNQKALEEKTALVALKATDGSRIGRPDFLSKLSNALRGLKQVAPTGADPNIRTDNRSSENVSWLGAVTTLGREEQLIFDNLYISGDVMEGIFADLDETCYELAGSFSPRTKQFELVGMSLDKRKSVKIKGELVGLRLVGNLSRKPAGGPPSRIELKLLGYEAKISLRFIGTRKGEANADNVEAILKVTEAYIYGMALIDKDYIFLSGLWERGIGYGLEITTNSKRVGNAILLQQRESDADEEITLNDDGKRGSQAERRLIFANEDLEMTIRY